MFRKKKRRVIATFVCPNCGTIIPATTPACPECGSDSETGWSDDWYPADDAADEEEDETVVRRRRRVKQVLAIGFSLVGALTIAALLAVELPPYGIFIGGAVILAVVIALIVFRDGKPSLKFREKSLERELLSISGHDPARVERLVNYERARKPDAPRAELLERAIDRLIRERSR